MLPKRLMLGLSTVVLTGLAICFALSLWRLRAFLSNAVTFVAPTVQQAAEPVRVTPPSTGIEPLAPQAQAEPVAATTGEEEHEEIQTAAPPADHPGSTAIVIYVPASAEERCGAMFRGLSSVYHDYHKDISDEDLKAVADSEDNVLAEVIYADRVAGRYWASVATGAVRHELPVHELFAEAQKYYVEAIRNGHMGAAASLAQLYSRIDPVEAAAWLLVEQRMGGTTLTGGQAFGAYLFGPDVLDRARVRADEMVVEFDLTSGLVISEECRA